MQNNINGAEAINQALYDSMRISKKVMTFGLGVTDPKGVFGTTLGLEQEFGPERVFDTPTSENAMTGVGIGLAIAGFKPVMVHQRLDFFILALDQLINSAAKFYYMYGGAVNVPITIRLIIGKGWGQGPTHSQNLINLFASIPGLKVVMPSNAKNAYQLLISAINDPNPVVYLEHRWIHSIRSDFDKKVLKPLEIGDIEVYGESKELAIISMSYFTHEALIVKQLLDKNNITIKIIDLLSIKPFNEKTLIKELKNVKKILILDLGFKYCSFASYLSNLIKDKLNVCDVKIIDSGDLSEPTSYYLTKNYYVNHMHIFKITAQMLGLNKTIKTTTLPKENHDVPNRDFLGPF
jgi:acetoin:2,6-dichlorophenolindophenol oxidoreductase subunit beta